MFLQLFSQWEESPASISVRATLYEQKSWDDAVKTLKAAHCKITRSLQ